MRPIYHRSDLRVQAHIFVTALAFLLTQGVPSTPERDTS
jgi:hypothetical protein